MGKVDRHWIEEQYAQAYHVWEADELLSLFEYRAADWPVVFDTETTGLSNGVPNVLYDPETDSVISEQLYPVVFGISLAIVVDSGAMTKFKRVLRVFPEWNGIVLAWCRLGTDEFETAKSIVESDCGIIAHNMKYDSKVCELNGIRLNGVQGCTMIQSRIWWNRFRKVGLKDLTEFLCPRLSQWAAPIDREMRRLKSAWTRRINAGEVAWYDGVDYANYSFIAEEIMGQYASLDAFMTLCLWLRLQGEAIWT